MDSRIAYLNIWQVLSDSALSTAPEAVKNVAHKRIPNLEEMSRPLSVHIARNSHHSGKANISHITWEFAGVQGMFFSCATFDGTGPYGTAPNKFALPGQKINHAQKALILLTLMEYTLASNELNVEGDFAVLAQKIQQEFDGGVSDLMTNYHAMTKVSSNLVAAALSGGTVLTRARA